MTNIPPEIQSYKRHTGKPITKPITIDRDGDLAASKFAGKPWSFQLSVISYQLSVPLSACLRSMT
ncbi:MAG: hypothetical protein F6K17_21225 [Okeania sp. SIO3C4]|nr:hypothetical protein [Okeania sp. SIO3B3]NER04940.1 hypothetical protein [Okeania sp. SIO3C4]